MMKLTALKIDPEFQGKIPPLTSEELDQLEKNIVSDGKVINPIIVWNGLIIDGHNRYAILQKHPDIPYTVHEKEFADRYEAIVWICKISWDVAILRLNKRTTLLESSMKQKSNPISTVATNTLHQRKVAVTKMVTAKKQVEPVNELLPKMASLEIPLFGRKNSPKA